MIFIKVIGGHIMKIAIVTDSTCDLSSEYLRENNVSVLPLKVICHDGEFEDGISITNEELVQRLKNDEMPTTSQPSPGDIHQVFEKLSTEGFEQVICIHISSGLSGTFNNVKMVANEFPNLKIEVIDSKMLSMGVGFLVMKAVQLRNLGARFSEMVESVHEFQKKTKILFVVKTLEYLKRGGRIGYISGSLGEILDIKPIIGINSEGKYYNVTKVRGRNKSIAKLKEMVLDEIGDRTCDIAVMHSDAREEAEQILQSCVKDLGKNIKNYFIEQIGPGMIVHCGPGLIGITYTIY
jgi:DegV family protein with EDD domain